MSGQFDGASSQHLIASAAPMGASPLPFTFFAWVYLDTNSGYQSIIGAGDASALDFAVIAERHSTDKLTAWYRTPGGGTDESQSVATMSTGVWLPVSGSFVSSSERSAFLSGVKSTDTGSNNSAANYDEIYVGLTASTISGDFFNGQIAECTWFDRELSDAEHALLHGGLWPRALSPGPVCYLPLRDVTELTDEVGGITFTNVNGVTQGASHPVIYYPLAGAQPAASGGLFLAADINLAGAQPASSGELTLDAAIALEGEQPAPSGDVVAAPNVALAAEQPAASADLVAAPAVPLAAEQPAASGALSLAAAIVLAGNQPAASGSFGLVGTFSLAANQPPATGALGFAVLKVAVAGPVPAPLARVYVHDGAFRRLGQLRSASAIARSYELGGVGLATFEVARTDPLIAETLTHGNVIVIESSLYPLPWVGAIARESGDREGAVRLQAAGYNAILGERFLPTSYTTSLSAGEELRRVLQTVNRSNATGIGVGNVQNHGALTRGLAFPNARANVAMDEIADAGGLEWWLDFYASPSNVEIDLRVASARGFNRFGEYSLIDGHNATFGEWMRDRNAQVFALNVIAGQTSVTQSFTERSRVTQIVESGGGFVTERVPVTGGGSEVVTSGDGRSTKDSAINFPHGFARFEEVLVQSPITRREVTVILESLKTEDITVQLARSLIERRPIPERTLRVTAYDTDAWRELTPGDVVRTVYPDGFVTGWDGPARILGTQPDEQSGEMDVVVELLRSVA